MHTVGLPRTCLGCTNVLFFILASASFVICVWCAVNTDFFRAVNYNITKANVVYDIASFVNLKIWFTPLKSIFIPIAVIAMMTSCCGIMGAGCQWKCAAKSYIILVTLLSFTFGWFFYVSIIYNIYSNSPKIAHIMLDSLRNNYGMKDDMFTHIWNFVMVNFECCGVYDFKDFSYTQWQRDNSEKFYPIECCILSNRTGMIPVFMNCTLTAHKIEPYIHTEGCLQAVRKAVIANKAKLIMYFILLTIAFALIILFAYCIIRGQPLLGSMAVNAPLLPFRKIKIEPPKPLHPQQSETSLENMIFADEAPKRIVKVVSASNPFQTFQYRPMEYSDRPVPQIPSYGSPPVPPMRQHSLRREMT